MPSKRKAPARRAPPPDPSSHLARLKRIKGQVEGIQRMFEDRRAGPEILVQIAAARAAMRSLEATMLRDHFEQFVRRGARKPGANDPRLDSLLTLFQRLAN